MLAVLEHIPLEDQPRLADACFEVLKPGGRVVITVPSPRVDDILHLLIKLHVIAGMSAHEHYGFKPDHTLGVFAAPRFRVLKKARFQLGLEQPVRIREGFRRRRPASAGQSSGTPGGRATGT